jgi:transposase
MTTSRRRFSREFGDELCLEVISTSKPVSEVAEAYGICPETLRNWLVMHRATHGGTDTELTPPERARLKEFERENQDLRAETVFLEKVSAYFAREER